MKPNIDFTLPPKDDKCVYHVVFFTILQDAKTSKVVESSIRFEKNLKAPAKKPLLAILKNGTPDLAIPKNMAAFTTSLKEGDYQVLAMVIAEDAAKATPVPSSNEGIPEWIKKVNANSVLAVKKDGFEVKA